MDQNNGTKRSQLAESLYQLYSGLGKPDSFSLLDRGIRLGWRLKKASMAGYEKIPVDPEFLHHLGGAPRSSSEVNLYIHGYELVIEGSWSEVRAGVDDLASLSERFGGSD